MANLLFKMGEYANLEGTRKQAGTVYITKDEQSMYVDISDTQRIKIQGTVAAYSTLTEFNDSIRPPYSPKTIYFIAEKDALIRWNDTTQKWVQLNASAKTVDDAIKALQAAINTNANDIDALETTTNNHNTRITSLETKVGSDTTTGSILYRIKTNETDIDALEGRATALEEAIGSDGAANSIKDRLGNLEERMNTAETDIDGLQELGENHTTRLVAAESGISSLKDRATAVEGRATNLESRATAVESRATALENAVGTNTTEGSILGRITANEGDIDGLQASLSKLDKDVKDTYVTKATYNARVQAVDKSISDINTAIGADTTSGTIKGRIKSLETEVGSNTTAGSIKYRITTNEADIEALESTATNHGGRITTLESKMDGVQAEIGNDTTPNSIKGRVKSLEGRTTQAEKDIDAVERRATSLESSMNTAKNDIDGLETNVTNLWDSLGTDDKTAGTVRYRVASLEGRTTQAEKDIDAVETRATNLETTIGSDSVADSVKGRIKSLEGRMTTAEGDINALEDNISKNYATKGELTNVNTNLTNKINDEIKAANAMTYKNGISAWSELPTVSSTQKPKIGDTYVVTKAFTNNGVTYQPGDLLVASGTETGTGSSAVITSNLTWSRVETGYSTELEPSLTAADNVISLNSYTDAPLGNVRLLSECQNLTLTTDAANNTIKFNLVWGSF